MNGHISLQHSFDAGHRIVGHKGKCARLHGHTYRFDVSLKSPHLRDGFILDFGMVKNGLNAWDHRMLLVEDDPILEDIFRFANGTYQGMTDLFRIGIISVPFIPTAENIAKYHAVSILKDLVEYQQPGDTLADLGEGQEDYAVMVEVWESPTTSARYVAT